MQTIVEIDSRTRYALQCSRCKRRWMALVANHHTDLYDVMCPGCGKSCSAYHCGGGVALLHSRAVVHTKKAAPTKCGHRCRSAKRHQCDCECGGLNHGCEA
jgi:hypothetical protein